MLLQAVRDLSETNMVEANLILEEVVVAAEVEPKPSEIGIGTTFLYPNYPNNPVDFIRGDLGIQMIESSLESGFKVSVVEDGLSGEFKIRLGELIEQYSGSLIVSEGRGGMASGRRKTLRVCNDQLGTFYNFWVEPEKAPLVDSFMIMASHLAKGADIVVPRRGKAAFRFYPPRQAYWEQKGNERFNRQLAKAGLLQEGEFFDVWFGPKAYLNQAGVRELFQTKWEFQDPKHKWQETLNPEKWAPSVMIPVVLALLDGLKVVSVDVDYKHPAEQRRIETSYRTLFEQSKRVLQYSNLLGIQDQLIRHLIDSGRPKASLKRVK